MSEISQYTESLHEECGVFGMYDKTGETDMVRVPPITACTRCSTAARRAAALR